MRLLDLPVSEYDKQNLIAIKTLIEDINILGHEENYPELGKELNYFRERYGPEIINEIMCTEEIRELVEKSE